MARLPTVGGDDGNWGNVLNTFLNVGHNSDGTLNSVPSVINVKDYGAKGDGSTDDTNAIQSAISAVESYGTIFIPPTANSYVITGITISPTKPFSVIGFGKASKLTVSGANYGIIIGADVNTVMRGLTIERLSIVGDSSGKGGIRFGPEVSSLQAGIGNIMIKDVDISGFTSSSVSHTVLSGAPAATGGSGIFFSNSVNVTLMNVYSHGNYYGEQESGTGTNTTVTHINCAFRQNTSYGVYLKTARDFSYTNGTVFESNGDSGFYAVTPATTNDSILDLSLVDAYFESNLTSSGSYQAIIGNDFGGDVRRFRADHVIFHGGTASIHGMKLDHGRESWLRDISSGDTVSTNLTTTNSTSVWVMGGRDDDGADVLDSSTLSINFDPSNGDLYKVSGQLAFSAGTGTGTSYASGVLYVNSGTASTDATTNENTLMSYSLPADSLSAAGKGLKITAYGNTANNTNTKTIKVKFAGTTIGTNDLTTAPQNKDWIMEITLLRYGATDFEAISKVIVGNIQQTSNYTANTSITWSAANTISVTGQNGTASSGDITAQGLIVETLN